MKEATEKIARETIKFSRLGNCVIGRWDNSTPFKKFGLYITTREFKQFRIGVNGAEKSKEGDCMRSLLDWAFITVVEKANDNSPEQSLLSVVEDAMYPDIHG